MKKQISYHKKSGDSYIFVTGLGLLLSLIMVAWITYLILAKGLGFFWPGNLMQVQLDDGKVYLGELWETHVKTMQDENGEVVEIPEFQLKIGNRDLYGVDFVWIEEPHVVEKSFPAEAVTIERTEYGNFYGVIQELIDGEQRVTATSPDFFSRVQQAHHKAQKLISEMKDTEKQLQNLRTKISKLERKISLFEISPEAKTPEGQQQLKDLEDQLMREETKIQEPFQKLSQKLGELRSVDQQLRLRLQTVDGRTKELPLSHVVRLFQPNQLGFLGKTGVYVSKFWEFVSADPRESNTEGGIFPAIFGTVVMVLLMSILVVPIGVMAALYLHEYAKQGTVIRLIRLSVNNLAGVPSIVFGVFGLGLFIYIIGGTIDQFFFSDKLPEPTFGTGGLLWASLTLALLTLPVVVVATEEGLMAVPKANKEGALALGATRWQMIRKIVLPNAMPGILTGLILAISRGAGEVAPLMITGVVKLAAELPVDTTFPFIHLNRKFMHLGFHIYDVGFQSPNVEAAKPMVYTTALLLIFIVLILNMM
ncbi:MAG: phosphate ABC transporter permease PstA, partial [Methanobacteriota archaeon]